MLIIHLKKNTEAELLLQLKLKLIRHLPLYTQAIQGLSFEASDGFMSNATAFGETWASAHLQTWRRRLGRRCSGIGTGGVIEGAERQGVL